MLLRLAVVALTCTLAGTVPVPAAQTTFQGVDGRIAFVAKGTRGQDIYTVRPDGTGRLRLTFTGSARDPRYDVTGSRIAYTTVGVFSKDVWVMRANGASQTELIATQANESEPAWSPDGQWLAYSSDESGRKQVHLLNIPTGHSQQLTFATDGLRSAWSPVWSPDGTRIAFVGKVPSGLPETVEFYYKFWHVVMTIRPDGTDPRQLTKSYFAQRPDWTPDSRRILYTNYGESYRNYCPRPTYWVRRNGTGQGRIGPRTCSEWGAIKAPGRGSHRVALWSDGPIVMETGGVEPGLYVAEADGSGAVRVANDMRFGAGLDWQPLYGRPIKLPIPPTPPSGP
jgi:hypothetical protein